MSYLLWFGIVAFVFALMHYFTELSIRQKGSISLMLTVLIAAAIVYNIQSNSDRDHVMQIELKFANGETLVCGDVNVSSKAFTYSVGTQSFIGNKDSKYAWQIFSASECE